MMGFEDLDVPVFAKARRGLFDETGKHVDADREVAGLDDGDFVGRLGDDHIFLAGKAGRANDKGRPGARRRALGQGDGRRRRRKIDDHVAKAQGRLARGEGRGGGVVRRLRLVEAGRDVEPRPCMNDPRHGLTHPAERAAHADPQDVVRRHADPLGFARRDAAPR